MPITMRWVVGLAVTMLLCGGAWCETKSSTTTKSAPPKKETIYWVVVEVKNLKGDVTWEAIQYKDLKARLARPHDEFLTALEAWNKSKADAAKNKTKFSTPKPVEGYVKRVGDTTVYKTMEEARDAAKKLIDQAEARKKAAEEAKAAKG